MITCYILFYCFTPLDNVNVHCEFFFYIKQGYGYPTLIWLLNVTSFWNVFVNQCSKNLFWKILPTLKCIFFSKSVLCIFRHLHIQIHFRVIFFFKRVDFSFDWDCMQLIYKFGEIGNLTILRVLFHACISPAI